MKIPIFTGKYHQKWWTFHGYVSFREGTLFATEKSCLCCFSRLKKVSLFFLAKSFAAKPAVVMSTCSSSGPSQRTCLADSKKNTTPSDIFGSKSTKHTPCSACSCLKRVFISQNKTGLPIFTITCIQFLANKKSSHRFFSLNIFRFFRPFFYFSSSVLRIESPCVGCGRCLLWRLGPARRFTTNATTRTPSPALCRRCSEGHMWRQVGNLEPRWLWKWAGWKKTMNRQSIEGRFFLVKHSSSFCGSSSSVICNLGVLQSMEMMWSFLGGKVLHFSMEAWVCVWVRAGWWVGHSLSLPLHCLTLGFKMLMSQ